MIHPHVSSGHRRDALDWMLSDAVHPFSFSVRCSTWGANFEDRLMQQYLNGATNTHRLTTQRPRLLTETATAHPYQTVTNYPRLIFQGSIVALILRA